MPSRFVLGLMSFIFIPAFFTVLLDYSKLFIRSGDTFIFILIGTIGGIVLDQIALRNIDGLETFEHELTHAVASLLFFRNVTRFVSTRFRGGAVHHTVGFGGVLGDDFIGLAPYFLPTFTFFSALIYPFIYFKNPIYTKILWIWIGFTFGYHIWSTLREIKQNWTSETFISAGSGKSVQSDIGRRGFIYSAIFITSFTLLYHSIILVLILKGYRGIPDYFSLVWKLTIKYLTFVFNKISVLISNL